MGVAFSDQSKLDKALTVLHNCIISLYHSVHSGVCTPLKPPPTISYQVPL